MRKIIKTDRAPGAIGPYSQAIKVGDGHACPLLFVSGQIPLDPKSGKIAGDDIKTQTKQVLENLKAIIEASDMKLEHVLKCTCFLKDLSVFADFNAVYTEYFGDILPARECVEVARLPRDVLVEISAICAVSL